VKVRQILGSLEKLTFQESAVSRLTQSRMAKVGREDLIEAAAKKSVFTVLIFDLISIAGNAVYNSCVVKTISP
jgi:hypothetical protein